MSPCRSCHSALLARTLFLALLTATLWGCAPQESAAPRTSEQMQGGGPPAPESHRPATTRAVP